MDLESASRVRSTNPERERITIFYSRAGQAILLLWTGLPIAPDRGIGLNEIALVLGENLWGCLNFASKFTLVVDTHSSSFLVALSDEFR